MASSRSTFKEKENLTWGFGVEHEMMFGVKNNDHFASATPILDSSRVVYRATVDTLERAFAQVARALEDSSSRSRIVSSGKRARDEQDEPKQVVRACTRAKPKSHALQITKTIQNKLGKVPLHAVSSVLHSLHPSAEMIGYALFNADWTTHEVFEKLYAVDAKFSATPPRAMLAQVLCGGGQDYDAFLEGVVEIVAGSMTVLKPDDVEICVGDILVVNNAVTSMWSLRRVRWSKNKNPQNSKKSKRVERVERIATPRELVLAAIGALRQRVDIMKTYDGSTAIELDGDYVEVKTLRHKNVVIEDLLAELRKREEDALAVARTLDASARILPHSGYADVVVAAEPRKPKRDGRQVPGDKQEEPKEPEPQYAGSYHFWFTLPHPPAHTPRAQAQFVRLHAAFGHALQWLEPLLLTCLGGDPRAIGAGTLYPRASMRGTLNALAGLGTTDTCGMARDVEVSFPVGRPFMYYVSEAALRQSLQSKEEENVDAMDLHDGRRGVKIMVTLPGGKREFLMSCLSVDRTDEWMNRYVTQSLPAPAVRPLPNADLGRDVPTLRHNALLRTRYAAGFKTYAGNDMRFTWCSKLGLELQPGWTPVVVKSKDSDFEMRFVHAKKKIATKIAPVRVRNHKKDDALVGFEFRLMDNMPREALLPLMRLFVLTMAAAERRGSSSMCPAAAAKERKESVATRAKDDPHWAALAAAVLAEGRFARVPAAYMRKLCATLGLSLAKLEPIKDARGALLWVCRALHNAYGKHPWVALLHSVQPKRKADAIEDQGGPPVPPDTNMQAWSDAFEAKCRASPELQAMVDEALKQKDWYAHVRDPSADGSWRYDLPYLREYLREHLREHLRKHVRTRREHKA